MTAPPRTRGFTLVEMMVALAIFGVIAVAGVAMLRLSIDNRAAMKTQSDRTAALQRARLLIKGDLAQAAPRGVSDQPGRTAPAFVSGADGLLLSLTRAGWSNPGQRPRASLQRVDYRLNGRRLERIVHQQLDGGAVFEPQLLYDGVEAVTFTFLSGGFESDAWPVNDQRLMPDAVRIDMTLDGYGPVTQWFLIGGGAG